MNFEGIHNWNDTIERRGGSGQSMNFEGIHNPWTSQYDRNPSGQPMNFECIHNTLNMTFLHILSGQPMNFEGIHNWDASGNTLVKNDWLYGFYGPKYTEGFYRKATDEEKSFLLKKMEAVGYIIGINNVPTVTPKEYRRMEEALACATT